MTADRFRRPTPTWCTDTAIRLLQIACREPGRADAILDTDRAATLLEAAKLLDAYGQRLGAAA